VALKSFVEPIRDRLANLHAGPEDTLAMLTTSLATTTACCCKVAAIFSDTDRKIIASLTHPLFQPYESFIDDYSRLEMAVLAREVSSDLLLAHSANFERDGGSSAYLYK
jgi:hypothetical protein